MVAVFLKGHLEGNNVNYVLLGNYHWDYAVQKPIIATMLATEP